jgi:plasmid replication initiation protein
MKREIKLAQDNKLTLSRQEFTPIEKRCLYYVIKEVRRLYVNKDIEKGDKVYQDLFSDMYLILEPEQLQDLGGRVDEVYRALRRLREREIIIDNEKEWIATAWILQAKHDKDTNLYTIQVSRDILPYLVELAEQFTSYSLIVAISLKSTYSQRFYELCSMYKNKGMFFLSIEKLLYIFKLEDKKTYHNNAHLKRRVIDVAQNELQTLFDEGQCDLYFTYRVKDKKGKKILSYWFDIHTRKTEEQKRIDVDSTVAQIKAILQIVKTFIKNDVKYIKRVETALHLNPSNVTDILHKLRLKVNDYPSNEIAPIIRYVLREDYEIK